VVGPGFDSPAHKKQNNNNSKHPDLEEPCPNGINFSFYE
jgi:hypothetical protein